MPKSKEVAERVLLNIIYPPHTKRERGQAWQMAFDYMNLSAIVNAEADGKFTVEGRDAAQAVIFVKEARQAWVNGDNFREEAETIETLLEQPKKQVIQPEPSVL